MTRLCELWNVIMHSAIIPILCLLATKQSVSARSINDDLLTSDFKEKLIAEELQHYTGVNLELSNEEQKVNDILMKYKFKEIDETFIHHSPLDFSKHYFTYKHYIEKSPVFQIIKKMPKGAALHIHSSTMLRPKDLLKLTYEDHLYACFSYDKYVDLQFSENIPTRPCDMQWALLSDLRKNSPDNGKDIDQKLKSFFTLYTKEEELLNLNINQIWDNFNYVHKSIKSLITYRPVREKYVYMTMERFYEDNIMYVEIRTGLHSLYELNGTEHHGMYLAELYKRVSDEFIKEYPDFLGLKIILARGRMSDIDRIQEGLIFAEKLKNDIPEIFVGFDLVGQEDLGRPLSDFKQILFEAKGLDYFFHAGETKWLGTTSDENLFDAFELGSKRIGHGYALIKHPSLVDHVLKNDIPIEVNVISNVVLKLVSDVRNHPLATYLAMGVPVVLSSDNPGAWESDPLSHDFYVTFMGVASKKADLRLLKTLALNSIKYSALNKIKKQQLYDIFDKKWKTFLSDVIRANCSSS
ncbi:adenosine deaminase 2-like [Plodia interpunctella]|uniref:adenosine deaminase 2-like n=1 Tax=Plodia interpunctella TaxID=58824 RepID=UPI002367FD5A|nr:adenosine deaminase 2-like [Plodia interpunctella]